MRVTFDSNEAYESFQFIWMGMIYAQGPVPVPLLVVHHQLMVKLARLSEGRSGGVRVLRAPCELELTAQEQLLLLDCMARTAWRPEVAREVRRACELLGAEFKPTRVSINNGV